MDRAYAGDVRGNLWAFDLSDTDPKNWKVAYNSTASKPVPLPLFTASHHITPTSPTTGTVKTAEQQKLCAGLPCVQQITSKPLVAVNPVISATQPNVLIFFGTGQYLIDSDLTSKNVQSFYGVWDHGIAELTPANLIEQTFLTGPFSNAGVVNTKVRVLSSNPVNYDRDNKTTNQGWFVNLSLANGERVVVDPDLRVVDNSNTQNNDLIFFNTWIPEAAECSAGGSGFLMSVDMTTGGNPKGAAFDLNGTGGVNDSDKVVTKDGVTMGVSGIAFEKGLPSSSTFLDDRRYTPGTDGGDKITTDQVITGPPMRRISWQELRNN
jgi:type IV pilus assembly protein PilY1